MKTVFYLTKKGSDDYIKFDTLAELFKYLGIVDYTDNESAGETAKKQGWVIHRGKDIIL